VVVVSSVVSAVEWLVSCESAVVFRENFPVKFLLVKYDKRRVFARIHCAATDNETRNNGAQKILTETQKILTLRLICCDNVASYDECVQLL